MQCCVLQQPKCIDKCPLLPLPPIPTLPIPLHTNETGQVTSVKPQPMHAPGHLPWTWLLCMCRTEDNRLMLVTLPKAQAGQQWLRLFRGDPDGARCMQPPYTLTGLSYQGMSICLCTLLFMAVCCCMPAEVCVANTVHKHPPPYDNTHRNTCQPGLGACGSSLSSPGRLVLTDFDRGGT